MKDLTHFNELGKARMVDITAKQSSAREAVAYARLRIGEETLALLEAGKLAKGDALNVSKIAGILAAKKTSDLIPLCHPIPLDQIDLQFKVNRSLGLIEISSAVRTAAKTGVEMEALTAVSIAALTLYDMLKASDKSIVIEEMHLVKKSGGRSGDFIFKGNGKE